MAKKLIILVMLSLKRFYALKTLLIWLSLSVAVTAETSPNPSFSNLDLVIPSNLSANPQLRQLIAQNLPRKALVIGNAAYEEGGLNNPVNDANAVAKALRELGFDVTPRTNLNKRSMHEEIEQFSQELTEGGVGLFYYAGHGVQIEGENYLIPLEAQIKLEENVEFDAYPLGKVINAMKAAKTRINILIIDACRDNPFYRRWRSPSRGLTRVRGLGGEEATQGWVIAFSTAPGEVAEDGEDSGNSPFTYHLLRHLKNPNEDVILMFRNVRRDVLKATNGEQKPWVREFLVDSFYFNQVAAKPSPPTSDFPENRTRYSRLERQLKERNWREANAETELLMLELASRDGEGWLRLEDIKNFPCQEIEQINSLWAIHSNNHFGYGVQKEIWLEVGGTFNNYISNEEIEQELGKRIGWRVNSRWIPYSEIEYSLKTKRGHLPTQTWWSNDWKENDIQGGAGSSLAQKIQACES